MTCDLPTLLRQACVDDFDKAAEDTVIFRATLLQLLCNLSGGAGQQVFSVNGPPTTQVPAFDAGIFWDNLNKIQYQWDKDTQTWVQ